jgi:hypothetical protein
MNNLEKIEPHALRLESAADKMESAGIGGHASRGHVVILRDMASCLRADAAKGRMSHEYPGGLYAAADNTARLPKGRLSPLRTPNEVLAANPEHEGTIKQLRGEGRRLGYELADDKVCDRAEVDRAFANHPDQTTRRLAWKMAASRIGILG